jgi:hypothetical protein
LQRDETSTARKRYRIIETPLPTFVGLQ